MATHLGLGFQKVGIYIGTFDPFHHGHLNLALRLAELERLECVYLIPSVVSPTKLTTPPVACYQHRCKMIELAILEIEGLELYTFTEGESPLYTIDLIERVCAPPNSGIEYSLLFAADLALQLPEWKRSKEILDRVRPVWVDRQQQSEELPPSHPYFEQLEKGRRSIPILDISSTEIRSRIRENLFVGHLLPAKVLDYIRVNRLY